MASFGSALAGPSLGTEKLLTGHFSRRCCLRCFQKMTLKDFYVCILFSRRRKIILLKEIVLVTTMYYVTTLDYDLRKILQ